MEKYNLNELAIKLRKEISQDKIGVIVVAFQCILFVLGAIVPPYPSNLFFLFGASIFILASWGFTRYLEHILRKCAGKCMVDGCGKESVGEAKPSGFFAGATWYPFCGPHLERASQLGDEVRVVKQK